MNKQELIEKIENLNKLYGEGRNYVAADAVSELVEQLDEPETGHADEAPRYVKNILARLRKLPEHDREVWLKAIMGEFERDFSHAKWREGYEQGKFEGALERDKVTIPPFMAAWINNVKRNGLKQKNNFGYYEEITPDDSVYRVTYYIMKEGIANKEIRNWVGDNTDVFARAWLDGYTIEEKRYMVKVKNVSDRYGTLNRNKRSKRFILSSPEENSLYDTKFTRKEIEDAGFGEVFNSPLFEIVEFLE